MLSSRNCNKTILFFLFLSVFPVNKVQKVNEQGVKAFAWNLFYDRLPDETTLS